MQVVTIPCSFDNYSYLIICEKSGEAAVVDPTEAFPVMRQVEANKATLTTVLCTHHHNDHVGDIGQLLQEFPALKVFCHASDEDRISHANSFLEDGDSVKVGELDGRILHTPGHTLGSICYLFENALFTGDTLFGGGCGRLFEGTAEQMYLSLNKKIALLPDETRLFFGHEYTVTNLRFASTVDPHNKDTEVRLQNLQKSGGVSTPSTLRLEKDTNPFLRCDSENVHKAIQQGGHVIDPVEVFTVIRQQRNSF